MVSPETEQAVLQKIKKNPQTIPQHVGIILDGNRRWAKTKRMTWIKGYEKGVEKTEEIANWALETGIKVLSLYAWSTENFNRARDQVSYMMKMFVRKFKEGLESPMFHQNKIRVHILGNRDLLPASVRRAAEELEESTKNYDQLDANFCLAYGGRQEIVDACRSIGEEVERGDSSAKKINEDVLKKHMYFQGPDPDLVIRTGGEHRISNFLLWHIAYSELYFEPKLLPELQKIDFLNIIRDYQDRQRRFGR